MTDILVDTLPSGRLRVQRWSPMAVIEALLRSRRETRAIAQRARRQRVPLGYSHIPARVWNRRSALLIERQSLRQRCRACNRGRSQYD